MKTFYVGIKGVIVKNNKVLVMRANSKTHEDRWEVPGGRIDGDETIEQALHRELREELPNIKNIVLEHIVDARRLHKDIDGDKSLVLIFYKVSADFDGEPRLSDEHVEAKWLDKNEAIELAEPIVKQAIRQSFEY